MNSAVEAASKSFTLFAGSSHPALAQEIATHLGVNLGKILLSRFPDGEISVELLESVRGHDVFVLQTIALDPNTYLMELLIIIDALRRASAKSITAVIPYLGYCRQDRRDKSRVPITAKLMANLIVEAGTDRVLTMDLHAGQIQGFFDIPVDNLYASPVLLSALRKWSLEDFVVATPDFGSVKLAQAIARESKVDFVIIDKSRVTSTEVAVLNLIGDVAGKNVLLADDMCSTGGTLVSAAKACREKGAKRVLAIVTHGLLVGDAPQKIQDSSIEALVMSNTIPTTERLTGFNKVYPISVASLFAQAIGCIVSSESFSRN